MNFSLAIGSDGNLYSWGDNDGGQLGNGTQSEIGTPEAVDLAPGVTPTAISAGGDVSLAIGSDGNLYSWGINQFGQVGNGTINNMQCSPEVITLAPDGTPRAISAGANFASAIGSDGSVYTWATTCSASVAPVPPWNTQSPRRSPWAPVSPPWLSRPAMAGTSRSRSV